MLAEENELNFLSLFNNHCLQTEVLQMPVLNKYKQRCRSEQQTMIAQIFTLHLSVRFYHVAFVNVLHLNHATPPSCCNDLPAYQFQ